MAFLEFEQLIRPAGETYISEAHWESPDELATALEKCRDAARRGYKVAKKNLRESAKAIAEFSKSLSQRLTPLEDGFGIVDQLESQIAHVLNELEQFQRKSDLALEKRCKHLVIFSVALFGRTMAGKSTLMEILTRGDGRSIGTGAQRTTRDVRAYSWNGLEVTDVPGIAAFEGAEDEELAFEAASQADLVLFLITDDAPQPVEAECLARVRRLGKPVLGICNVKVAVDDEDDRLLFLRSPDKPFDQTRLDQLLNQFHAFADQYFPGKPVPFVATHLRSRYLAQRPEHAKHRDQLLAASRFDEVESYIKREVVGRGAFLRFKSFVDSVAVPMMDLVDRLLELSEQNSSSARVMSGKNCQFAEWSKKFRGDGDKRIETFVSKIMDDLHDEVPSFAEDHYEDNSAGESWKQLVESMGIDRKIENLQKGLIDECKKALSEVARELTSELSLVDSLTADRQIKMDKIFDLKRAWDWGTIILGGGLGIAALIVVSGPLGWAAAAVGIVGGLISWFFDDREVKAAKAREKLAKRLRDNIGNMDQKLRKGLEDWFHQKLIGEQVEVLLNDLSAIKDGLFKFADAQRKLAWTLNDQQKMLGRALVDEVLAKLKSESFKHSSKDIARVPGFATMSVIGPNVAFPLCNRIEHLLGEQIMISPIITDPRPAIAWAVEQTSNLSLVKIQEDTALVAADNFTPTQRSKIKLIQQLTKKHVMKAF